LVIPIDKPSESLIFPSLFGREFRPPFTIAAEDARNRQIPLVAPNP
jgi:hypothetical protein